MKNPARLSVLAALISSLALAAQAQVIRLPQIGAPTTPIGVSPSINGASLGTPTLSPNGLISPLQPSLLGVTAAPIVSVALAAEPAADAAAPLKEAGKEIAAAQQDGKSPEKALDKLFNEKKAPEAPAVSALPSVSDDFAKKAEALFYRGQYGPRAVVYKKAAPLKPEEVPTDAEMNRRMSISPLTNPEREAAAVELFKLAGAKYDPATAKVKVPDLTRYDQVQIQEAGQKGKHNIFVVKKGKTDRIVVVGSHVDKVSRGRGVIDNWTGTTMDINAYQALQGIETDATYVFVTFAREEEGLYGSAHFLRSLSRKDQQRIDAMVNLDTLAVDGTFSWKNNSTRSLLDLIKKVADAKKLDLKEDYLNGGDADSSTFRDAGIPAMTLFGASQDVIFDIIHSEKDTMAVFSLKHYKNALLLTVELLKELGGTILRPAAPPAPNPA